MSSIKTILFTGKGGVGKTTCAAATAFRCAHRGYRTLIISTDPAHSLGDSLDISLGPVPAPIREGLFAMEIDPIHEMRREFDNIKNYVVEYMGAKGIDEILAEEMVSFPGAHELFCMLQIERIEGENEFDVLVLDMAPTGNTFRFLNFPEFLAILRRGLVLDRYASKVLRLFQGVVSTPVPDDIFFSTIFELFSRIEDTKRNLVEKAVVRLVVNLDKMSIMETQRALTFLNLSMFSVDSVIINRVIPGHVTDPYFDEWKKIQERYTQEVEDSFFPLQVLKVKLFPREIVGRALLEEVGSSIYNDLDPAERLTNIQPFTVNRDGNDIVITVSLPFTVMHEISVKKMGERILVKAGPFSKVLYLPLAFIDFDVAGHAFDNQKLTVNLSKPNSHYG